VKLKRLIIQGFKSFKDRTVVEFDDGITGIVGPNGCGKSNIVDSLFWVMGAQSAKHLRGNSMKDVIFSGSSKYSPATWAEVSLVLENTGGKHIHIGNKVSSPSEIQLTRKLYRNGDTEYRINNEPARLKDIQEVFMDTGAGAKSYSIIAQGEINRLVQAKPVERRTMIEEVAGITKFKIRKRESMRKIEATQSNLNRLNDLQSEIEKNLRALQKQAERAERARSLKGKIRRNELVVNSHKVFDHLKDFREARVFISEKTLDVQNWTTRKESLEVSLADERLKKDDRTSELDGLQKEYNEISRTLAASEERLNHLADTITQKEKLVEDKQVELEEIKADFENRTNKKTELINELEEIRKSENEAYDFEAHEIEVEELKEKYLLASEEVEQAREDIEEMRNSFQTLDQQMFRNTSKLEEFAKNIEDWTAEIESVESEYSGLSTKIANEREVVQKAEELALELSTKENDLKNEVTSLAEDFQKLEKETREKSKELIQTESKLVSLKEINRSLEGVTEGSTLFLEESGTEAYQLLGTLIQCDDKYTGGVQALLGDFLQTLVSKETTPSTLIDWINGKEEIAGLEFLQPGEALSVSEESLERLRLAGCSEIKTLESIVKLEEGYEHLKAIFSGYFLVDNLDQNVFNSLSTGMNFKALSSFDGKTAVKNAGGAKILTLGSEEDSSQGVVERNNRITELEVKLEELTELTSGLQTKLEEDENILLEKRSELENLRNEAANAKADAAGKKSALESKLETMQTGNKRLDILKNRKTETSKERLELLEAQEKIKKEHNDFNSKVEEKKNFLEERESANSELKKAYEENRDEFLAKKVERDSFNERMKGFTSQLDDIESQLERLTQKQVATSEAIESYSKEIEEISADLDKLEQSNMDTADDLQAREEKLNGMKDDLAVLLQGMQDREDEVKKLNQDINKTDKEIAQRQAKLENYINEEEQIVRDIFEKYHVDLRQVLGEFLSYEAVDYEELADISSMYVMETEEGEVQIKKEEYEFNRRYGQDLKDCGYKFKQYKTEYGRLGEINWQAIEDYERQKMRFDFLKIQENELRQSLEDLEKAISHIDEKSRKRFKIAFEEVNTRFEKVFPIIFGGGMAKLQVTGDLDDAECGVEIIAQPPGKKMQNINLMSGGEKAMTAVSLIFSIFLVKPSPFCLLDEVDAPLDDANVGRFNELLREMSAESQFILITHNKKTMELNDSLYGVTMQEAGVSKAVSVQLH
tara:strand:- start:151493 stop:155173 length:3681 start_codon:yes stop_codon:yes gene_type:complete